jgi:hypothetical protein
MAVAAQFCRASGPARLFQFEMTADALLVEGIMAVARHA